MNKKVISAMLAASMAVSLAAPDSRFPIADFYLRQLPAFKLSCVNCNPSRAILCGTYLIIKGVLPCVNLQLVYLKQL